VNTGIFTTVAGRPSRAERARLDRLRLVRSGDPAEVVTMFCKRMAALHKIRRLAVNGYTPTLAAVDGTEGYPAGAPYDRIIATCAAAPRRSHPGGDDLVGHPGQVLGVVILAGFQGGG
jgi:Protein-L-isoaspartate(D-aspartate) O-methyltransferase (PCMT)